MSENPGHRAIAALMAGGGTQMSKPQDAPVATTAMSDGMTKAANAMSIPSPSADQRFDTSPASVTSLASLGSSAQTATASPTFVASPAPMTAMSENENRDGIPLAPNNQLKPAEEIPYDTRSLTKSLSSE